MAIDPYRTSYLLVPIHKGRAREDLAVTCATEEQAEALSFVLGLRKFTVIKQVEMTSVVRDKIGKKPNDC